MVLSSSTGSKVETPPIYSAVVRRMIQSIKEIVGNHSDADIYVALKETNMDPNEAAQKLLTQDPFHEVRRKRDKKKENVGNRNSTAPEPVKQTAGYRNSAAPEPVKQIVGHRNSIASEPVKQFVGNRNSTAPEPVKHYEPVVAQGMKSNSHFDRNIRRSGYSRNISAGVSREFRVVRDNRLNQNREIKSAASSASTSEPAISNVPVKSAIGTSSNQKPPVGSQASQDSNGPSGLLPRQSRDASAVGISRKNVLEEKLSPVSNAANRTQIVKTHNSHSQSTTPSNNSVVGVYSSSSDPVHVPSRDSRPAANVGAIRREVGVVGARRQSSVSAKPSSSQSSSVNNSNNSQNLTPESSVPAPSVGKTFSSNQYGNRPHQSVGHQKAPQPSKEWKPKSNQKSSVSNVGVIGVPAKAASPSAGNSKELETEASQLQDKLPHLNISDNQNVIIAAHIRVSETDRCRLTFGSLGADVESGISGFQALGGADELTVEPSGRDDSVSVSVPESSSGEPASNKHLDISDDRIRNSGSSSPASLPVAEHQPSDGKDSSSAQNLDNYAGIGLVQENNLTYTPSEPQQSQYTSELPSFSAYDPQTGYDIPYFRPAVDETVRGQGLPPAQEAVTSHMENSIPVTTIALAQQQQALAQMYPQLHVSHYANLMPYRQFISPVYVPPMAMPGYPNSPGYPHPSNGSSYLLMPGGSSHLTAGGLKYGMQQFKPVPAGAPTGFGNFPSPTGYAINTPGVMGGAPGLEDTSRLKYKDGNLYLPNPQAETSEIWMNPRDIPSLQSSPYYNMPGQTPHAAYMPSQSGHASFNAAAAAAAAAQSSHMQFQGLYHPSQPAPHHLGAAPMGGNVGLAGGAPGPQVGAYQQPQYAQMNWTANF